MIGNSIGLSTSFLYLDYLWGEKNMHVSVQVPEHSVCYAKVT